MLSKSLNSHAVSSETRAAQAKTESEELQQEISMLRTQLEQAQRMATVGELTSTTTHEFNNLLMSILNYAKLGCRHKDEASRDKAFDRILNAANRASKITNSVLAMARNRSADKESTSLKSLLEDALLLLEREYRKYRIDLQVQIDDVPLIHAAGNDLQRVFVNLLVNARQATREGGQVRVRLQHSPETNEIVFSIRDNGCGISSEDLPRIFEPFYSTKRGPDATGRGGTGVGLSACKQVIDAHDGRIRVESTLGKGTAFIIRLPLTLPATQFRAQAS